MSLSLKELTKSFEKAQKAQLKMEAKRLRDMEFMHVTRWNDIVIEKAKVKPCL